MHGSNESEEVVYKGSKDICSFVKIKAMKLPTIGSEKKIGPKDLVFGTPTRVKMKTYIYIYIYINWKCREVDLFLCGEQDHLYKIIAQNEYSVQEHLFELCAFILY